MKLVLDAPRVVSTAGWFEAGVGRWALRVPGSLGPVAYVRDRGHNFYEWWLVVAPFYAGHCNSLAKAFEAAAGQSCDGVL